jgi:hypothetical protein
MTYAVGGSIQASDYSNLVGSGGTANTLNAVWSTGSGSAGYGQTALATVSAGNTVAATNWANLVNTTANVGAHQGSTLTAVTAPVAGGSIAFISAIPTNLQTTYANRLNASGLGTTSANTVVRPTTWSDGVTFDYTVSFANGDAARYFFNAGGSLKITCSHANNAAGINLTYNQLASNVGTIAISSPSSGSITVASVSYNGVTKIGGGDNANIIILSTNQGYYGLSTAAVNTNIVFQQLQAAGVYGTAYITAYANTSGTIGVNGDRGNVMRVLVVWDNVLGSNNTVGTGTTTTLTAQYPSTTTLANTWGTVTLTGSQTGG